MTCAECLKKDARYHELVKELLAMKREGFTTPPVYPELQAPPQLDAEIELAISETFDRKSAQAREQVALAWTMKRAGQPPESIALAIRQGEPLSL